MWLLNHARSKYIAVPASNSDGKLGSEDDIESRSRRPERPVWSHPISICLISLLCLAVGFIGGKKIQDNGLIAQLTAPRVSECKNPTTRKEWRSLSGDEKSEYIAAVRCLLTKPSKMRMEGVLYDDFPYVHSRIGGYSHGAAAFLSWHRYLLHIYESELRTTCGYNGGLAYWDWSLDWESLANSPIFSNTTGFGGNGDLTAAESVGDGHCVTEGPFSDLTVAFYNTNDHIHCLSRGFTDGKFEGRLPGDKVKPSAIEEILSQSNYESFFTHLEKGPHNQIPNSIKGDFLTFTAPNDPIFFLHHSQLDRLWWMWQQANPRVRLSEYGGKARYGSEEPASIHDVLPMGGLAPDISVSEVMSSKSDLLCYRY